MSNEYILGTTVRFAEVDRDQVMVLPALFQLLQEAAIRHADQYGVGAAGLARFPRRDETEGARSAWHK
jgi:acyl-CoA thioesterase FadM